ncbi:MotA/TolQ/ExbB proton channel family protein [Xenococcus sp. PCC 7305]|uniref:MotA/TolQ/ExbB proton channel family protein n=1 Tax=Xenococcus sp. PCC 7305 TaxID=102125 RepID=UPI0002F2AD98|nr:MotA/TolQ/ExbB proton channel family protein [Xenococcus sp. PCC 7305]
MQKFTKKVHKFQGQPRHRSSKRQELEVGFFLVSAIAAVIVAIAYGILIPFRESTIGTLLYERGFTQIIVMILAAMVVATTVLKFLKLKPEYRSLTKLWIAEHIPLENPGAPEVLNLQERLAADGSLIATRCSRVLDSYIKSGDRNKATEFALDDSSFYQSASESSYSVPRILVWAIPLLGFIGTVVGISKAVNGFSGFLQDAGDVEQIKEGIGTVTGGLAVAFDTTLLALLLSVLVMIPLVLIERYESRLLLGIDIFINDKLLPRLREKNQNVNEEMISHMVGEAINQHFPNPEKLIAPAHSYAERAANSLAEGFLKEIGKVQDVSSQVISQVDEVRALANKDRQEFMTFFAQQQQVNQQAITQIKTVVEEIKNKNYAMSNGLNAQAKAITEKLEKAAQAFEKNIVSLDKTASKIVSSQKSPSGTNNSLLTSDSPSELTKVLEGIQQRLALLEKEQIQGSRNGNS